MRCGLIEEPELTVFRVDGEGADRAALLRPEVIDFVYGVEIFAAGMDGEEGGIFGFGGEAERSKLADARIKTVGVDSFAGGLIGVGADENQVWLVLRAFRGGRCGGKKKRSR